MTTHQELKRRIAAAIDDPEFARLGAGLDISVKLSVGDDDIGLQFVDGRVQFLDATDYVIEIHASEGSFAEVLKSPPPATFHAFTAFDLANPAFEIVGSRLDISRARPVLERLFERVTKSPAAAAAMIKRDLGLISGQYRTIDIEGRAFDIYFEKAGSGTPILFLHTAGADSRQFQGQLSDVGLAQSYTMYGVDLPFHGRSMPPRDWDGGAYTLDMATYRAWCRAIIEQIIDEPAIIAGGSMGAAMALVLAADCPELVRGIVGIEPPFRSKGRRNPFQHHAEVHGALHNSSFVRGLMSPTSPEADRRRAAWIYSQGAPGIYPGDLSFYSDEFDGAEVAPRIDAKQTPVALLCGTYDYSATPADGQKLADLIAGSTIEIMDGLGHFPMCEHPDVFRPYLVKSLTFIDLQRQRL